MEQKYILTIKAESRPGLLHLVSGMIEKRLVNIISLTYAPTDIHDIVLITAEIHAEEAVAAQLALKLENIVEVFAVEVSPYNEVTCLRAAYFKLSKTLLETPQSSALQKYSAVIVKWNNDTFLAVKYGSDTAIRNLYNEVDSIHLLGFSQTGLITDSKLIGEDESSVINRLAA